MSIGHRASTCASCGKRLTRKQWYYRNNKYFCKKRCWVTEAGKAAEAGAKEQPADAAKAEAKPAAAAEKK